MDDLKAHLEIAAITLPLDIVLEVLKATHGGRLSPEALSLMKIEVASVLSHIEELEDEDIRRVMRETFGPVGVP